MLEKAISWVSSFSDQSYVLFYDMQELSLLIAPVARWGWGWVWIVNYNKPRIRNWADSTYLIFSEELISLVWIEWLGMFIFWSLFHCPNIFSLDSSHVIFDWLMVQFKHKVFWSTIRYNQCYVIIYDWIIFISRAMFDCFGTFLLDAPSKEVLKFIGTENLLIHSLKHLCKNVT